MWVEHIPSQDVPLHYHYYNWLKTGSYLCLKVEYFQQRCREVNGLENQLEIKQRGLGDQLNVVDQREKKFKIMSRFLTWVGWLGFGGTIYWVRYHKKKSNSCEIRNFTFGQNEIPLFVQYPSKDVKKKQQRWI